MPLVVYRNATLEVSLPDIWLGFSGLKRRTHARLGATQNYQNRTSGKS